MAYRSKYYKDKEKLRNIRQNYNKKYYGRTQKYNPRRWTYDEDEIVLAHEMTDTEISSLIKRSVQSIQGRRHILNKIKDK